MKLLLYICLLSTVCLFSCAKDDLVVEPEVQTSLNADMAYIAVHVATENEAAGNGGCVGNERCIINIEDATVILYLPDGDRRPPEASVISEGLTDQTGVVDFGALSHESYKVDVISAHGETTVDVHPAKGRYTQVLVRL